MNYNFKFIGNCDISKLKQDLSTLTEENWQEHQIRQNKFGNHENTNTLEILWDPNSLFTNTVGKVHNNFFKLNIEDFLKSIEKQYYNFYGPGYFIRALITRLKPNTIIGRHQDNGFGLENCRRTHIPLQTNTNVLFEVGNEIINMKEGEIWEINNSGKEHAVYNNSNNHRIHFILDYNLL
jgi:hypothetical protein